MSTSNSYRHEYILNAFARDKRLSVHILAADLQVSGETIRRDFKELEAQGKLRRIHGGAILPFQSQDQPIDNRILENTREKEIVAELAVKQIREGSSIFLDTGSTTLALARRLTGFKNLRLYTNSIKIAVETSKHHGVMVFLPPGRLRKVEQDIIGEETILYIQRFCFDIAFMGSAAIDINRGAMDYESEESSIRQALIKNSHQSSFLVDSSKFKKTANVLTASFTEIDQIIIDKKPEESVEKVLKSYKTKLIYG